MSYLDVLSQVYLDLLGWGPIRINAMNFKNSGMPDFECTEKRYVEVKKIYGEDKRLDGSYRDKGFITINTTQLIRYKELGKNNKIYLMVFGHDLDDDDVRVEMFSIKHEFTIVEKKEEIKND